MARTISSQHSIEYPRKFSITHSSRQWYTSHLLISAVRMKYQRERDLLHLLPHKLCSVGKTRCTRHYNTTAQSLSFPVSEEHDLWIWADMANPHSMSVFKYLHKSALCFPFFFEIFLHKFICWAVPKTSIFLNSHWRILVEN